MSNSNVYPPQANKHNTEYVGRFAPSPSGPLHFGSLVCAIASFLHARQAQGKWLLRIEDIDTPRVDSEMTASIMRTLEGHGLTWDAEPVKQSDRSSVYEASLNILRQSNSLYACRCTRKQIKARAAYYDRHCENLSLPFQGSAIRWLNNERSTLFFDEHYGEIHVNHYTVKEDPVLKRADGIYSYHLAVISDDIDQHVTHIVRGADLIDITPLHQSLYSALSQPAPKYLHVPIAVDASGQKLSKQQMAPALDNKNAIENVKSALVFLGLEASECNSITELDALIQWAIENWQSSSMSMEREIQVSQENGVYSVTV